MDFFKDKTIIFGTPTLDGKVNIELASEILVASQEIKKAGGRTGWATITGCSNVAKARNKIVESFLSIESADLLFFLDSDMHINAASIIRLIQRSGGTDVLAGAYMTRGDVPSYRITFPPDIDIYDLKYTEELLPVSRIGTGCMIINRDVLETLWGNMVANGYMDQGSRVANMFSFAKIGDDLVGEDFNFCDHVIRAGFSIHTDAMVAVGHVRTQTIRDSLANAILLPEIKRMSNEGSKERVTESDEGQSREINASGQNESQAKEQAPHI